MVFFPLAQVGQWNCLYARRGLKTASDCDIFTVACGETRIWRFGLETISTFIVKH